MCTHISKGGLNSLERPNLEAICYVQVKDVQQMLKGVVSCFFIVLNKLPRHVSASKCHLQGVTLSFHKQLQFFSLRWTSFT
jgi:hypothetical protein